MFKINNFLIAIFILLSANLKADRILNLNTQEQQFNQWCWAGSSKSILDYRGTYVHQCNIAEYMRQTGGALGSVNCCVQGHSCNLPQDLFGSAGIEGIMHHWGRNTTSYYDYLNIDYARSLIDNGNPFVVRWGWHNGGGHFVVGYGMQGNSLYFMDPWFGEGKKYANYNWVVNNTSGSWTHSLVTH